MDEIVKGFSIDEFFQAHADSGWKPDTVQHYRKHLKELQTFLEEYGPIEKELLCRWRKQLEQQHSRNSVRAYMTAANHYFQWCGRSDLLMYHLPNGDEESRQSPAITRTEYLRLLRTAKEMHRYRAYLLIKLFATTGIPLQCLDQVTVGLIQQGQTVIDRRGCKTEFRCPNGLQQELLEYANCNGICSGPIFVTRAGNVIERTNVFRSIKEICQAAGILEEKGNPRSLRKLYRQTMENIAVQLAGLQQQMYDQILEQEQDMVGLRHVLISDQNCSA